MKEKIRIILILIIAMLVLSFSFSVSAEIAVDGTPENPYLISNYSELSEFRSLVNGGEVSACAKLTADIDVSAEQNWTQIGTGEAYTGTFDGNGYKIEGFSMNGLGNSGLFKNVGSGEIKNLIVLGNALNCGDMSAGLVGNPSDETRITKCMFIGDVISTWARTSGISRQGVLTDCIFAGTVSGSSEICGMGLWAECQNCIVYGKIEATAGFSFCVTNSTAQNCYYKEATGRDGVFGGGTKKTEEEFASGELAFALGSSFGQKIGTDPYPVFRTEDNRVYFTDGVYTNTKPDESGDDEDDDSEGITEGDGSADSPYVISSASKLKDFCKRVNGGENGACAVLTSDINAGNLGAWTPIGSESVPYKGKFNGNGYTVKGINVSDGSNVGLFGYLTDAEILNINVFGTVKGFQYVGGVAGQATGTTVFKGCHSGVDLEIINGGATIGGICGVSSGTVSFENCFVTGNISGTNEVSGISLWGIMKNCYVYGKMSATVNLWVISASSDRENCYYLSGCAESGGILDTGGASPKSKSQFASGEVAYLLGSAFGQIIGRDEFPMLYDGSNEVSKGDIGYYNTYATPEVLKTDFISADNSVNENLQNVSRFTKEIRVRFNGKIEDSSIEGMVSLRDQQNALVDFEGVLSEDGKLYTLKLKDELENSGYILTVSKDIVNFMGNNMKSDYVKEFKVCDYDRIILSECKLTSNNADITDISSLGSSITAEISLINPYASEKSLTLAVVGYEEKNGVLTAKYISYLPLNIDAATVGKIEPIKETLNFDNTLDYSCVKIFVFDYPVQRQLYMTKID